MFRIHVLVLAFSSILPAAAQAQFSSRDHVFYATRIPGGQSGMNSTGSNAVDLDGDIPMRFGRGLAAGDFNCDGIQDLAIGNPSAPDSQPPLQDDAEGQVLVLYGSNDGLKVDGSQQFRSTNPDVNFSPYLYGYALAAGRLNADNCSDLAIGIPGAWQDSWHPTIPAREAGGVEVLRGSANGLRATARRFIPDAANVDWTGPDFRDYYGASLAIGNVITRDQSLDELLIGVPGDNSAPLATKSGSVEIRNFDGDVVARMERRIFPPSPFLDSEATDFGSVLAVGDFNRDGREDTVVGAPRATVGGDPHAGMVLIRFGWSAPLLTVPVEQRLISRSTAGVPGVHDAGERFGAALAVGDFDADGRDDLAIGIPGSGTVNDGAVLVGFGRRDGEAGLERFREWKPEEFGLDTVIHSPALGTALAVGDFTGDGIDDLAIGAPLAALPGNDFPSGVVMVLAGTPTGLGSAMMLHQNLPQMAESAEFLDRFGQNVSSGDFDGDSIDDLAVAVVGEERTGGAEREGAVHVFYGQRDLIFANGFEP